MGQIRLVLPLQNCGSLHRPMNLWSHSLICSHMFRSQWAEGFLRLVLVIRVHVRPRPVLLHLFLKQQSHAAVFPSALRIYCLLSVFVSLTCSSSKALRSATGSPLCARTPESAVLVSAPSVTSLRLVASQAPPRSCLCPDHAAEPAGPL